MLNNAPIGILNTIACQGKSFNNVSMATDRDKKTAQIGLRLSPKMKAALEEIGKPENEDRSLSWLVNRAVEEYLRKEYPALLPKKKTVEISKRIPTLLRRTR